MLRELDLIIQALEHELVVLKDARQFCEKGSQLFAINVQENGANLKEQILRLCQSHPKGLTVPLVCSTLHVKRNAAALCLTRMKAAGMLRRPRRGLYQLAKT